MASQKLDLDEFADTIKKLAYDLSIKERDKICYKKKLEEERKHKI